ncbi:MAG: lactate racemase domain-containing protein, partial [Thermoleophilia bacterium]|nr:lactate racemase domain-containing protein [Thermoleophilia bacterium]
MSVLGLIPELYAAERRRFRLDTRVRRVPLLAGSRVVLVPASDEDVLLAPPPPAQAVDVPAAVRDALRFPLSGPPLEEVAPRGGRATVVVEPPALPLPGAQRDPRSDALAAVFRELERCAVPTERLTILVASGLARRFGRRELERLLPPSAARAFRGRVVLHDAEADDLAPLGDGVRANRALVESDLVVTVTAAETAAHGASGALVGCCDALTIRRSAGGLSLLEALGAPAWRASVEIERALAARAPVLGVSLVLDLPRLATGPRGYPHDRDTTRQVARSRARTAFSILPAPVRAAALERLGRRLEATAAFAGPPTVAHAEALVRGVELRGTPLQGPLDALVVGIPWLGPHLPRTGPNPITATLVALGLAVRQHRNTFPLRDGGTIVLL